MSYTAKQNDIRNIYYLKKPTIHFVITYSTFQYEVY